MSRTSRPCPLKRRRENISSHMSFFKRGAKHALHSEQDQIDMLSLVHIQDVKIQWLALIGDSSTQFQTRISSQSSFFHDKHTKCGHAIPVPGKAKSVYLLCAELGRLFFGCASRVSSFAVTTSRRKLQWAQQQPGF